jgi:glycosyltransferase involved in cell wall biosynthesis
MKVSVIIPYKEDRGWLEEAIESIETQRFAGTLELILSKSNGNVSYNLNQGIKKATGDYIKYVCDDDKLAPHALRHSLRWIKDADFMHGSAINFFENGRIETYIPHPTHPTLERMLHNNVIHGGTLFYKANVFEKYGLFDETLDCAEEYDMNLRLLKNNAKLTYCNRILYHYRRHSAQKSLGVHVDQVSRAERINAIKDKYR